MSQIPPIDDNYIDEVIKSTGPYNPAINKTQGVKLRELIKKIRDYFVQETRQGFNEQNFATIAERDAHNVETLPFQAFVSDDGDGKWALYRATSTGVGAAYIKISDSDLLSAAYIQASPSTLQVADISTKGTISVYSETNGLLKVTDSVAAISYGRFPLTSSAQLELSKETSGDTLLNLFTATSQDSPIGSGKQRGIRWHSDDNEGIIVQDKISHKGLTGSELFTVTDPKDYVQAGNVDTSLGLYQLLSGKGQANGYPSLDANSKIPNAQLPPLAITDIFPVNSQAAMLALSTAEQGDVAIRSDINKSFILSQSPASTLSNWLELLTPTGAVQSVNGMTGVVNITDITGNAGTATNWGGRSADLTVEGDDIGFLYGSNLNLEGRSFGKTKIKSWLGINDGSTLTNSISGNAGSATNWGGRSADLNIVNNTFDYFLTRSPDGITRLSDEVGVKNKLGLNDGSTLNNNITGNAGTANVWGGSTADFQTFGSGSVNWLAGAVNGNGVVRPLQAVDINPFLGINDGSILTNDISGNAASADSAYSTILWGGMAADFIVNISNSTIGWMPGFGEVNGGLRRFYPTEVKAFLNINDGSTLNNFANWNLYAGTEAASMVYGLGYDTSNNKWKPASAGTFKNWLGTSLQDVTSVGNRTNQRVATGGYDFSQDFGANHNITFATGNATKGINMGYNEASEYGFIGVVENNLAWRNLVLQPIAGKVGIGITSPTEALDVNGNIKSSGLAGTGNRPVSASPDGTLIIGTPATGTLIISVTYSELIDKIGNSELVPEQKYLITDFQSTFNEYKINSSSLFDYTGVKYSGSIEQIIVTAAGTNSLYSTAYSRDYPNHELQYTTDNKLGGILSSTKGTILSRKDVIRNLFANFDWISLRCIDINNNSTMAIEFDSDAINCEIYNFFALNYGNLAPIFIGGVGVNVKIYGFSFMCCAYIKNTTMEDVSIGCRDATFLSSVFKSAGAFSDTIDLYNSKYIGSITASFTTLNITDGTSKSHKSYYSSLDYSKHFEQYVDNSGQFIVNEITH